MLIGYNKLLIGGGDVIFQTKTKGKKIDTKIVRIPLNSDFFVVHFM